MKQKVEEALRKVSFFRRIKKIAIKKKGVFLGKVREAQAEVERHEKWLKGKPEPTTPKEASRIAWHEARLQLAKEKRSRRHRKLTFWRKRYVWARNRDEHWEDLLEARKRKLKAQEAKRKISAADFETWMTRGHEHHTLPPAEKAIIAIGTLHFGLWTSSTYRPETPGSHHSVNPTRVVDMAGEWNDMIAFQRFLIKYADKILELFGPDNGIAADNGVKISLSEGSFLEDLHDSHVHAGFMDLNFDLSINHEFALAS